MKYIPPIFKKGDRVRSYYSANWYGVVLEVSRNKSSDIRSCTYTYRIAIVFDQHRNPMRKILLTHINGYWLKPSTFCFEMPAQVQRYLDGKGSLLDFKAQWKWIRG